MLGCSAHKFDSRKLGQTKFMRKVGKLMRVEMIVPETIVTILNTQFLD